MFSLIWFVRLLGIWWIILLLVSGMVSYLVGKIFRFSVLSICFLVSCGFNSDNIVILVV